MLYQKADQLVKKRRQALQYNRVELEDQSINEEGETYCGGGLIEVLDTSKYHCACVCCAQACIEVHDYV